MTPLIALFARVGLPERFRRAAALVTSVIAVAALCGLLWTCWIRSHDAAVIEDHEAGITAKVTEATTAADNAANANDAKLGAENARADEQLRSTIDAAEKANPEAVRRDAGPATRDVLGKLRERTPPARPAKP